MMQVDVKFIRSISDPNCEKEVWFPESELLARYMIFTLARLIKLRFHFLLFFFTLLDL